ncbi:hypothetical protein B0J17DRAFT_710827, partial [Rhizoctonia solani]
MFESISPSIYPAMQKWEETKSLMEGTPPGYVAARIDLAPELFHALVDKQVAESRSTLSQGRNRVLSSIYCFPEEVLSEIFMHAAFSFENVSNTCNIEEHRIFCFYRRLHHLLGVCSTCRSAILSRGIFWPIVP